MGTAIPRPQPNAAGSPSEGAARGESKRIALLVVGLVVAGAFVQRLIEPSAVSVVVYTAGMSLALIAAAHLAPRRLLPLLAGFRVAAASLALLAVASALGTLIVQGKAPAFYGTKFGALAAMILTLRLDDLFHSLWFGGLVALMNAGLVTSALRRWPVTLRNVGFFSAHLGILVIEAGAGLSAVFTVKARVDLHVGETASTAQVISSGLPTPRKVALGAAVQLLKFDVDHWADQPRVLMYLPGKKGGYDLKASFENEVGVRHRLPDGAAFRVRALFPDLVMSQRLVESGGNTLALKLTVDGKETFLTPGERSRVDARGGQVTVVLGRQRPSAKPDAPPLHTVKGAQGEAKPIQPGEDVSLADGTRVKALRFFPHFSYDIDKKEAVNVSDAPVNPALEVEVAGARRWLFAKMPGFSHAQGGPQLTYAFAPQGGSAVVTVIAVDSADRTVLVRKPDGTEQTLPFKEGLEVVDGIRLGALLEKASIVREPATASQQMKNPAVLVEISEGGRTREVLMTAGQREPVPVGRGLLTFETHVSDPKAFRSEIAVWRGADEKRTIVSVNNPVSVGPWKLYQANYRADDPSYSGLDAVRDPGVSWVFTGFGLLFLGVSYLIYAAPRMRAKEG